MQRHTLSVTRIQSHEGFTPHELCWPARKSIPKLEHRIGSDRIEVVITVDKACQALPNDVKERIERGKRSIGRVTHRSTRVFGTPTLYAGLWPDHAEIGWFPFRASSTLWLVVRHSGHAASLSARSVRPRGQPPQGVSVEGFSATDRASYGLSCLRVIDQAAPPS